MPTFKGDAKIVSESASGITIGGKTIEEIVAEEESKEMGEELTPDRIAPYHKCRSRHKTYTESNGFSRVWSRREINAATWEKMLMDSKDIYQSIIGVLLSGREMPGQEICRTVITTKAGITKKEYTQKSTYLFNKTDFGKLLIRRREGKGFAFKLCSAALDCKQEELMVFTYAASRYPKRREQVLAHHKSLRPYFEPDPDQTTSKADPQKSPGLNDLSKPAASKTAISAALETALSNLLGVNVNVSGRIEIVFKIGD